MHTIDMIEIVSQDMYLIYSLKWILIFVERKGSISNFRVMLECSNVEVVIRNASRLCKI